MMDDIEAMNELRLLCNDNSIEIADVEPIRSCARKFGVPVVAAYRRAKDLGMLTYQQPAMTAPNNPTPEVERWHFSAPLLGSAKMITRKDGDWLLYEDHLAALQQALINLDIDHADAISRLTAERDAMEGRRDFWAADAVCSHERAETAEKRVKELETALNNDKDEGLWRFWNHKALDLATSNKLLSERIAGLEKERDVLAYKLDQAVNTVQPQIINRAVRAERIISSLNPEEAADDSLLRDIHRRLVIHGVKYPDRMVSVLHRNVVFYTIAAAVSDYIGGKKS